MTGAVQHDARERTEPVEPASGAGRVLSWRRMLLIVGALALFAVAMLASAIAGHPTIDLTPEGAAASPLPEERPTPTITPGVPPAQEGGGSDAALVGIGIALALIVSALAVLLLLWIVRRVIDLWRSRRLRRQPGADTDVEVGGADSPAESEPDGPTVRRGIAAARDAIEAHPAPTDAIIAAWVGLEETAADSGVGRGVSETPAEFTLRILLRRPGIERPAQELLAVYEGVRFGGHRGSEQDRALASRALALIEEGWR